jgi:hypothetical protein
MFYHQAESSQLRQCPVWEYFLNDLIREEAVRTAWRLNEGTYDTGFQRFMDEGIAEILLPPRPALPPGLAAASTPG